MIVYNLTRSSQSESLNAPRIMMPRDSRVRAVFLGEGSRQTKSIITQIYGLYWFVNALILVASQPPHALRCCCHAPTHHSGLTPENLTKGILTNTITSIFRNIGPIGTGSVLYYISVSLSESSAQRCPLFFVSLGHTGPMVLVRSLQLQ